MRFLSLFLIFLLTSCQSSRETMSNEGRSKYPHSKSYTKKNIRDGAPLGPIPSFFKRIIPRAEPMSRHGNPSAYRVMGRTYTVLRTAHGYHARGLASWYGTKFHRQRTSSGECYDLYALTAAHKTLPIPTYVKVKNLINGREIIVKVNDRGPFHEGRIIDLSYGAAAKLGVLPRGTVPVEVTALATSPHVAHYYLQAGAFSSRSLAQNMRQKIARFTKNKVFVESYGRRFIVKVGPLTSSTQVEPLKRLLAKQGISGVFSVLQ